MKKIVITGLMLFALALTGCKDWLDINTNPNYVTDMDVNTLLPTPATYTAAKLGYDMQLVGSFWSQYVVQSSTTNQYYSIQDLSLAYTSSNFSAVWTPFYSQVIPTLNEIISKCEAKENPDNYLNYVVQAKVLKAFDFYILTSLYDQVAYTEGFKGEENLNPKFDTGKAVQESIVSDLEAILAVDKAKVKAAEAANSTAGTDMIFAGNMDNWFKFANSLYLKMMLRDFGTNKTKIESALSSSIGLLEVDAKYDHFMDAANKSNPFYESDRRMLNTAQNIRCCSDVLNLMDPADNRAGEFYDNLIGGAVAGYEYGSTAASPSNSSRLKLAATDPVYFLSAAESYFNQAEAYARLNLPIKAKEFYNKGVEAAFERWGLSGTSFVAEGGAYEMTETTTEAMVKKIIIQKWIAAVRCQAWEAWFDMNRTGYPERGKDITAYSGSLEVGEYPMRYLYPERSSLYNSNTPEVVPINTKMWWHK